MRSFVSCSSPSNLFSSSFWRATSSSRVRTSLSSLLLMVASSSKPPHCWLASWSNSSFFSSSSSSCSPLAGSSSRRRLFEALSQMVLPTWCSASVETRTSSPSGTERAGFAANPKLWNDRYCSSKQNLLTLAFSRWPTAWLAYLCSRFRLPTSTGPCNGLLSAAKLGFVRILLSAGLMAKLWTLSLPKRSTSGAALTIGRIAVITPGAGDLAMVLAAALAVGAPALDPALDTETSPDFGGAVASPSSSL
mmetsp:Transcript_62717/g.141599  ORF Transcript_62717/g.141599 Transcript_62717/m.141599 type:complete len:249 (+) Transcript_62717:1163-1909(+)